MSDLDGVKLAVTVKPLEWGADYNDHTGYRSATARSIIGAYDIYHLKAGGDVTVEHMGKGLTTADTWDEAKAAAQADYARRILSALSPAPEALGTGGADDALVTLVWELLQCMHQPPQKAGSDYWHVTNGKHVEFGKIVSQLRDLLSAPATPAETQADEVGDESNGSAYADAIGGGFDHR